MKNLFLAAMITATSLAILSSCKKETTTTDPVPSATITIASPYANQIYRLGDTMYIVATIEGNVKMHGYDVVIVKTASGDTVYRTDEHTHEMKLNVNKTWCCNVSSVTDLRLYISSALNHDGLAVVKSVDFKTAL